MIITASVQNCKQTSDFVDGLIRERRFSSRARRKNGAKPRSSTRCDSATTIDDALSRRSSPSHSNQVRPSQTDWDVPIARFAQGRRTVAVHFRPPSPRLVGPSASDRFNRRQRLSRRSHPAISDTVSPNEQFHCIGFSGNYNPTVLAALESAVTQLACFYRQFPRSLMDQRHGLGDRENPGEITVCAVSGE